jgi:hypothetical protein
MDTRSQIWLSQHAQHTEIPASEMPPQLENVLPGPGAAGGLENIPEELLTASEATRDEIDHAGLDVELPAEDQAPLSAAQDQEEVRVKESWGRL